MVTNNSVSCPSLMLTLGPSGCYVIYGLWPYDYEWQCGRGPCTVFFICVSNVFLTRDKSFSPTVTV